MKLEFAHDFAIGFAKQAVFFCSRRIKPSFSKVMESMTLSIRNANIDANVRSQRNATFLEITMSTKGRRTRYHVRYVGRSENVDEYVVVM